MSRTFFSLAFLLIVIAGPGTTPARSATYTWNSAASGQEADEPTKEGGTNLRGGTLTLMGTNDYSGRRTLNITTSGQGITISGNAYPSGTTLGYGTLQLGNPSNLILTGSGTLDFGNGAWNSGNSLSLTPGAAPQLFYYTTPNPAGVSGSISGTIINGFGTGQAQPGTTFTLGGINTYTGGTTVTSGTLQVGIPDSWSQSTYLGTWGAGTGSLTVGDSVTFDGTASGGRAASTPTTPIPAGPVFYIITEGAGIGDSVRSVPCTGKETVLLAVGHVNGISQLSSTKVWIARPSPASPEKSTILPIDWEAISRRGINTTNYTLQPGDRLVFGQDPQVARSNKISRKTASVERVIGVASLTGSTLAGLNQLSPGEIAFMKQLVRKGAFADDDETKQLLLDALKACEQGSKKPSEKAGAESKPSHEEKKTDAAAPKAAAEQKPIALEGTLTLQVNFEGEADKKPSPAAEAPPHELAMQSLPAYRIEPPDVISIEMLKLIPLPPFRAAIYDAYQIRCFTPPDFPSIDKCYIIEADGTIDLGPPYGSVKVVGMTKEEMNASLTKALKKFVREPDVYSRLARATGSQPVTGQYLVGLDGTVNLRNYGRVNIAGKTVAEARLAIQDRLKKFLDAPELSVDVVAYNSKVYYVITQGAGIGDSVRRVPSTGHETVLDAFSLVGGLSQFSSKNKIRIVRPSDNGKETILPIDWDGITGRGATATNYQIFPGDRIYIGEDAEVLRNNLIIKRTAPVERLAGITSLTSSMLIGMHGMNAKDRAIMTEMVRKGMFTDDEQLKATLLEAIRLSEQEREKAPPKEAEKSKPGG